MAAVDGVHPDPLEDDSGMAIDPQLLAPQSSPATVAPPPLPAFAPRPRRRAAEGVSLVVKAEADDGDDAGTSTSLGHGRWPTRERQPSEFAADDGDEKSDNQSLEPERRILSGGVTIRTKWTKAETEALWRAVDIVPHLANNRIAYKNSSFSRASFLAEYIRRQTGYVRLPEQVNRRMRILGTTGEFKQRLRGPTVPHDELRQYDWNALLGPDRFPLTALQSDVAPSANVTRRKRARSLSPARQHKPSFSPDSSSTATRVSPVARPTNITRQAAGSSVPHADKPVASPPQPARRTAGKQPEQLERVPSGSVLVDKSASPRPAVEPDRSEPLSTDLLSALLSSFVSGRNFAASASALVACGITSSDRLANLLIMDEDVLSVVLDIVGRRRNVGGIELAFTKRALATVSASTAWAPSPTVSPRAAGSLVIPAIGTFLNFVSYAAGAVRLAALSHLRVIWVATHDSIGLGEDGPTHQPIETVAHFRALPNCNVWRPADGNETSASYYVAMTSTHTPSILCLTRQNLPQLAGSSIEKASKGGYVLHEVENADVTLVATGSEVAIAVEAAELLEKQGLKARVSSLPCWEVFRAQSQEYKLSVLPDGAPIVSVEAYTTMGWAEWSHAHCGVDRFGSSGPAKKVYKSFNLTGPKVAERSQGYEAKSTSQAIRSKPYESVGWTQAMWKAMERGLKLVKPLGERCAMLKGQEKSPDGLLTEYIFRQTGRLPKPTTVSKMRRLSATDSRPYVQLSEKVIRSRNWDAVLGPVRRGPIYELVKPHSANTTASSSTTPTAVQGSAPAGGKDVASKRKDDCMESSDEEPLIQRLPGKNSRRGASLGTPNRPDPLAEPAATPVRSASESTLLASSASPEPSPSRSQANTTDDIAAFLTAYGSSQDWTATAAAFVKIGFISPLLLIDLVYLEDRHLQIVLKRVSKKASLGGLDLARLKKALRDAKEELDSLDDPK